MGEAERCCVQGQRNGRLGIATVQPVAENRTAEPGKVNPELVGAAGERNEFDERHLATPPARARKATP